mgnify:FL=1
MADVDDITDPGILPLVRTHEKRLDRHDDRLSDVEKAVAEISGAVKSLRWAIWLGMTFGSLLAALVSLWIKKGP